MSDLYLLPALLLLGLGFLFVGSDDAESEDSGTLGQSDSDEGQLLDEASRTFIRLDDTDDTAAFGIGDQVIFSEAGDDQISAGAGNDQIFLSDGDDTSFVDIDDDGLPDKPIDSALGDDFIRGGDGNDIIIDGEGANELFGDLKSDRLDATENDPSATDASDVLFGGFGSDTLIGDDGDEMHGGEGADHFVVEFDSATDDPVLITDYEAGEEILVQVPATTDVDEAIATPAPDGSGINVEIDGNVILTIAGLTDPDQLSLTFEAVL